MSGIVLNTYKITSGPDVIPDPIDWGSVSPSVPSSQQVTGINTTITLSFSYSGTPLQIGVGSMLIRNATTLVGDIVINSENSSGTLNASNGNFISISILSTQLGASGTLTVNNNSDTDQPSVLDQVYVAFNDDI